MNNRKITVSLLTIASLFSANAFAQITNRDVSTTDKNDNARQQSVQKIINEELNAELPNTDTSTALAPSISSRNAKNEDGTDWGEGHNQTFIPYKVEDTETGNKKTANCIWDASNNACNTDAGVTLNTENKIVVPTGTKTTASGFIVPSDEVLLDQGNGDYKEYFYRYWITNPGVGECADGLNSCWSASYPIICLPGVSTTNFRTSIQNKELKSSNVRDFFGARELSESVIFNGYQIINGDKNNVDYRMRVKVTADNFGNKVNIYGNVDSGEKSLRVARWKINKNNHCLEPDFNLSDLMTEGYTKTNVIDNYSNLSNHEGVAKNEDTGDASYQAILPCGAFQEGEYDSTKYYVSSKTGELLGCAKETDAWVTKKSDETQNYTRYKIDLPTSDGSFASATEQNYLNVRGCAVCEAATNHCIQIIKGVIENNEVEGCSCVDLDNGDGKGSCIYDKTVTYDDDGTQKTRTEHVIATNRYYDCTESGLTNLISRLTTDGQFKLSAESGVYNNTLSCDVCLNKLEENLRTVLIDHK